MLRAICLAMTLLALPLERALADAAPSPSFGKNAALSYWQAFATLPKFTDDERQQFLAECLTAPLDVHAREMVSKGDYALRLLHIGAAMPRCDWGYSYDELGIGLRLAHNEGARALASLACLRARLRFADGKNAEAVNDIIAAMTLGRHSSHNGVYIMVIVGYAVEQRAIEALAQYLPKLDAASIKELRKRLDALPPMETLATALRTEEKWALDWLVQRVRETKDKEELLDLLNNVSSQGGAAFLAACGGNAAGVIKTAEEVRPSYALISLKLELPLVSLEEEWDREEKRQAGNPVFRLVFPNVRTCRRAQARLEVRRALLSAACAVQVEGQNALKSHLDPVMGGQFEYAAIEGGFELRSKMKNRDDKTVTLTVGKPGK